MKKGSSQEPCIRRTTHYKNTALKPVTTYFQTSKIGTNFQPISEVKISTKATQPSVKFGYLMTFVDIIVLWLLGFEISVPKTMPAK